jgi:hypothetical protein
MMMPTGSDDTESLRSFFILGLLVDATAFFGRFIGTPYAMLEALRK